MSNEEIKPCPFCGGEVHDYPIEPHKHTFSGMPDHPGSHVIECYACDSGKIGATRDEVIAAWNRREQPAIEATRPNPEAISVSAADVLAERRRQVEAEGWTPEHDDAHNRSQLAKAAACYVLSSASPLLYCAGDPPGAWPWLRKQWKPSTSRRDLVKAGALILAEIERIDRAAEQKGGGA